MALGILVIAQHVSDGWQLACLAWIPFVPKHQGICYLLGQLLSGCHSPVEQPA